MPDSKAKREWMKEHTTCVSLKLNNNQDAEIIKKLNSVPSRQGYIKALIKADLAKS